MSEKVRKINHLYIGFLIALVAIFLHPCPALAKSGCCSWHGGVCGCDTSTGRQVCCDGTYSPTCTCTYTPPEPKIETKYEKEIVAISFKTEKKNDPNLLEGKTEVRQEGKNGKKEITYKITYTDGKQTSKQKVSEEVLKQPTSKIVAIGTKRVEVKTEKETTKIPFETEEQEDPTLPIGERQVIQDGEDGEKEISYEVTYVNGERSSKEKISEEVIRQSIPKIIAVGTKKDGGGEGEVAGAENESEGGGNNPLTGILTVATIGSGAYWIKKRSKQKV